MASANDVKIFLDTLILKMNLFPQHIHILNQRPENMQTRLDLEITINDQMQIIRGLSPKNYCSGPLDDDKGRDLHWWVFGKEIKGKEVYIKLSHGGHNSTPLCMSFHIANNKLDYPHNT